MFPPRCSSGVGDFNPRSRKGSDTRVDAPFSPTTYFNPRSRKGSDTGYIVTTVLSLIFQSTLPQGERQVTVVVVVKSALFQSTLPQGERPQKYPIFNLFRYSCFSTNNQKILITITYKLLHAFFLPYFRCEPICKSMYACSSHLIS